MKLSLFIIVLFSSSYALGQSKIVGIVKEGEAHLPLVNIVVSQDSIVVKSTVTDSLGNYVIDNLRRGRYQLTASLIGYVTHQSFFSISGDRDVVTVNDISLLENSYALDEIVIESRRALLEQKADRMIINLSGSMTAGNTVLEVLQKSPGVVINRQLSTIAVNGKSGVRIMINEKIVQVPADVVVQMLEGMSASNVDKIELITTPPSNYDANGSGGIIHIITRKTTDYGTSGSMTVTLGAHWAETLGASGNINHRSKNAAYFADYAVVRNHNLHIMDMRRQTFASGELQTAVDHSHRENKTTQQNLSVGAEWKLGRNTSLNILITGYKRNWRLNAVANNATGMGPDSVSETSMAVRETNIWQSGTGSIGVQHTIDAKSKADFTVDYLFYHNNNPSDYDGDQKNNPDISLSKSTPIHFLIAAANYKNTKTSSLTWDAGLKAVVSTLNNDVSVKRLQFNEWVDDAMFTSNSTLHEQVFAGYVSAQWLSNQKWEINSGLRYEYTRTSITSASNQELLKRNYGYLFPTISFNKKLTDNTEVHFSYARRITRPTYNDIAPYVFFWSPNSFSSGNTALYPALPEAIIAGYHDKQWSVSLQYTHAKKEIAPMQPEIDRVSNSLVYRSQNLKYLSTIALTSSFSVAIASWWEAQATVVGQYQTAATFHLSSNEHLQLFGVNITTSHVISLPKDFAIEVGGMYQSRSLSGISNFLPFGSLNAGIQKKLGPGVLRLSVDDILYTNLWRIRTISRDNNVDVYFRYDWHNQFARVTYTWNLGNGKLRTLKLRPGSEEERKRVD